MPQLSIALKITSEKVIVWSLMRSAIQCTILKADRDCTALRTQYSWEDDRKVSKAKFYRRTLRTSFDRVIVKTTFEIAIVLMILTAERDFTAWRTTFKRAIERA